MDKTILKIPPLTYSALRSLSFDKRGEDMETDLFLKNLMAFALQDRDKNLNL